MLDVKIFWEILNFFDQDIVLLKESDSNSRRSGNMVHYAEYGLSCYQEMYAAKKSARHTTISSFFKPQSLLSRSISTSSEKSKPDPSTSSGIVSHPLPPQQSSTASSTSPTPTASPTHSALHFPAALPAHSTITLSHCLNWPHCFTCPVTYLSLEGDTWWRIGSDKTRKGKRKLLPFLIQ